MPSQGEIIGPLMFVLSGTPTEVDPLLSFGFPLTTPSTATFWEKHSLAHIMLPQSVSFGLGALPSREVNDTEVKPR